MKSINIDKIVINPEYVETTISISGLLSSFVFNMSFLEDRELIHLSLQIKDKIEEIIKNKYLSPDLLK